MMKRSLQIGIFLAVFFLNTFQIYARAWDPKKISCEYKYKLSLPRRF